MRDPTELIQTLNALLHNPGLMTGVMYAELRDKQRVCARHTASLADWRKVGLNKGVMARRKLWSRYHLIISAALLARKANDDGDMDGRLAWCESGMRAIYDMGVRF